MNATSVKSTESHLARYWQAAGGTHELHEVEAIQVERFRSVYRLHFRRGHPPVIAKYCPTKDAEAEHRVYLEILPAWGIDGPAAYGLVATDDPGRSWFFMGACTSWQTSMEPRPPSRIALSNTIGHLSPSVRSSFPRTPPTLSCRTTSKNSCGAFTTSPRRWSVIGRTSLSFAGRCPRR